MANDNGANQKLYKRVPAFRVTDTDWKRATGLAQSRQLHITNVAREALHLYLFMQKFHPDVFDSLMRKCFSGDPRP
jgi:hypothetical protein